MWQRLLAGVTVEQDLEVIIVMCAKGWRQQKYLMNSFPGRIVVTKPGRANQLNAGLVFAKGDFFWLLHADSQVNIDEGVRRLRAASERSPDSMWYFDLRFFDGSPLMKINEFGVYLRSRFLKMPFGDQGLAFSRKTFVTVGKFNSERDYGEDLDYVWRCRGSGIAIRRLGLPIGTSSRKYMTNGWLWTTWRHLVLTYRQALPWWCRGGNR